MSLFETSIESLDVLVLRSRLWSRTWTCVNAPFWITSQSFLRTESPYWASSVWLAIFRCVNHWSWCRWRFNRITTGNANDLPWSRGVHQGRVSEWWMTTLCKGMEHGEIHTEHSSVRNIPQNYGRGMERPFRTVGAPTLRARLHNNKQPRDVSVVWRRDLLFSSPLISTGLEGEGNGIAAGKRGEGGFGAQWGDAERGRSEWAVEYVPLGYRNAAYSGLKHVAMPENSRQSYKACTC